MTNYIDYSETYAECYDLITNHKNYCEEIDKLIPFLQKFKFDRKILSVGCGIGKHESHLAKHGYTVFGIDKSEWMINLAISRFSNIPNLSFGLGYVDAEKYLGVPFQCVISLFNVINCLPDLISLRHFFEEIFTRLDQDGLFFFEAWNGVECLLKPPEVVVRDFKSSDGNHLNRKAVPRLNISRQHLDITYEIIGSIHGRPVSTKSVHSIRLFTVNEIIFLLSSVGFTTIQVFSSLPDLEPYDIESPNPPRMLSFLALK